MLRRAWIGVLFVILGIGVLLHQMGVWDFADVFSTWWPVIFILLGIFQLSSQSQSSSVIGLLLIIVGGLLLFNQWIDVNLITFIWPLIFIFIGLAFIFSRSKNHTKQVPTDKTIQAVSLFSGTNMRSQTTDFQGGSVTAIFGGSEIDLRDTLMSNQGATIDLTALFGGITITIPENTRLEITGIPIFGGWEDKTRQHVQGISEDDPVLILNCLAVCGGIEIKD